MPGPMQKPAAQRRRTNTPTIPTTKLPASGYRGKVPKPPYRFGLAGAAWWKWAWRTPSAAAWGPGDTYCIGRRAMLEDDLAALELPELDLADFLDVEQSDALNRLTDAIKRLKSLAGSRATILRIMGDLDKRIGLDPKSLAENHWTIDADPPADSGTPSLAAVPDAWRSAAAG